MSSFYLHQGDHVYPAAMSRGYGINANGQDFYDLLNTWLTPLPLWSGQSRRKFASGSSSKQL